MRNQQVLLKDYHVSPEVLWTAVKKVLHSLDGVTFEHADDAQMQASFKTGVTWTSWGQNMIAQVEALEGEGARLDITGQIRSTFLATNWGEELHEAGFVHSLTNAIKRALPRD